MDVSETIELAKEALGISQTELADLLGIPKSHLSGFKNGRPCGVEKHAQIAYVAGLTTRARLILLESVLESSRKTMPEDEALRTQLEAIIKALPDDQPTITTAPQSRGATARGVVADKPRLRKSLRTSMERRGRFKRREVRPQHRGEHRAIGPFFFALPSLCKSP